jgi:hypothetical protein
MAVLQVDVVFAAVQRAGRLAEAHVTFEVV